MSAMFVSKLDETEKNPVLEKPIINLNKLGMKDQQMRMNVTLKDLFFVSGKRNFR